MGASHFQWSQDNNKQDISSLAGWSAHSLRSYVEQGAAVIPRLRECHNPTHLLLRQQDLCRVLVAQTWLHPS